MNIYTLSAEITAYLLKIFITDHIVSFWKPELCKAFLLCSHEYYTKAAEL